MNKPEVVIAMGSQSDFSTMKQALKLLKTWGLSCDVKVVSAHRTPKLLETSVKEWERVGVKVIIAGAGGAAHLPGMLASFSILPVIGVPIESRSLKGLDSLLSIAQMPKGVPVATVSIGNAENAALLALKIMATSESKKAKKIRDRLYKYKDKLQKNVKEMQREIKKLTRNL